MKNLNENIDRVKKLMNLNEASNTSDSLFGGSKVNIPSDGAHAGQSGWQSSEAWDIPTSIGTPVYSLTNGTLETFSDYGQKSKRVGRKTLFGQSFTVKSESGSPDVYYTHLKDAKVKKGDTVKCGQYLGTVMDFPGSSYDHVHIGVKPPGNIRDLVDSSGKIKCKGKSSLGTQNITSSGNSLLDDLLKAVKQMIGLNEEKVYGKFGKNIDTSTRSIILPKETNTTIYSPVSGKVVKFRSNFYCDNRIVIQHSINNKPYYLEFCGIDNLKVSEGSSVNKGSRLGETESDVTVSLYNTDNYQENLKLFLDKDITDPETKKTSSPSSSGKKGGTRYYDPLLGAILDIPRKIFNFESIEDNDKKSLK